MKLVDTNVLLYAINQDSPNHRSARTWLDRALAGSEAVGMAWIALLAFLRLSTSAALFARPLSIEEAIGIVRLWLAQPAATWVHPTPRHLELLAGLLQPLGSAANLVNDAHLAALALEHGAEIVSFDSDFARFAGVTWAAPSPSA